MSENPVQEPDPPDEEPPAGARTGGAKALRRVGLVTIVLVLLICTGVGSVLVNVDWPGGAVASFRVVIGAILLTLALLCGELLVRIILDLRRGRRTSSNLDLPDRLGTALANRNAWWRSS